LRFAAFILRKSLRKLQSDSVILILVPASIAHCHVLSDNPNHCLTDRRRSWAVAFDRIILNLGEMSGNIWMAQTLGK
jgi:hypothetical protein